MAKYCIVAARPKAATNHLNSSFLMWAKGDDLKWTKFGWKSIAEVGDLIRAGNDVRTGQIADGRLNIGAPVELGLRIASNNTKYKISDMPDQ